MKNMDIVKLIRIIFCGLSCSFLVLLLDLLAQIPEFTRSKPDHLPDLPEANTRIYSGSIKSIRRTSCAD
jgi:hypothetical protein